MRPFILTVILFFSIISAGLAQKKNERYCELIFTPKGLSSTRWNIKFSAGEADTLFSLNTRFVYSLKHVEFFNNIPDAMNYMSSLGWTPMNFPSGMSSYMTIYFKKELDPSEMKSN